MKTKTCFKCGIEKELSEYYAHKEMGDGHLNKCKSCTKIDTKKRTDELAKNPEWVKKERSRHREKYFRLDYKKKHKPLPEKAIERRITYNNKYPEKYQAKIKSGNLKASIQGNHLHHWSYNKEHYKDVIELSMLEHNKLHRYIVYDQERMMYRRSDNNQLLDTKEKHYEYFLLIKDLD